MNALRVFLAIDRGLAKRVIPAVVYIQWQNSRGLLSFWIAILAWPRVFTFASSMAKRALLEEVDHGVMNSNRAWLSIDLIASLPSLASNKKLYAQMYEPKDLKMNIKLEIEMLDQSFKVALADVQMYSCLRTRMVPQKENNHYFNIMKVTIQDAMQQANILTPEAVTNRERTARKDSRGVAEGGNRSRVTETWLKQKQQQQKDQQTVMPKSGAQPHLKERPKKSVRVVVDLAIQEIIQPMMERSMAIVCVTWKDPVQNDFAMESDENKMLTTPYVVENVDPTHWVYLRHKGAEWCLWQSVGLDESKGYVWEEPLLPPRLLARVDPDNLRGGEVQYRDRDSRPSVAAARLQAWGMERVCSEETGTLLGQIKLIRYITALPQRDEDSVRRGIARASALKALERHSNEASSQNDVNRDLSADGDDQRSNSAGSTNGALQNDWGPHADVDLVPSREDNRRQESQSLLVKESDSGETVAKGASASGTSEKHVTAGGKEPQVVSMTYIQELENALGAKKVLAATGILATDLSGTSDPYCVYYLKIPDYEDVDIDAHLRGSERRCTSSRRRCTPSNTSSSRSTRASTLSSNRRSFSR